MLLAAIERALEPLGVTRGDETRLLVACSGGLDSTVLAYAAVTLYGARRVFVAHVDHGVRAESAEDARAVARFAASIGAPFLERRVTPTSDAEAALREARYAALAEMQAEADAAFVLTAHTEDDQAESVLMALVRTGSLSGIPPRRDAIVRPLLDVPKSVLRTHAERHGLEWREDPTNREPRYLRNRIRKELLPLLERRYRPGIRGRLARMANGVSRRGESADEPRRAAPPPSFSPEPIRFERRPWDRGPIPDGRRVAIFDASSVGAFTVRPVLPGDRIRPYGRSFHRKVRDVLREGGVPVEARGAIWVVQAAGEVLWIPGLLRGDGAPVRETTKDVWVFWTMNPRMLDHGTLAGS